MPTQYRGRDSKAARLDQAHPVHPRRTLTLTARPDWMLRAACRVRPGAADDFFPDRSGRGGAADCDVAKAVCRGCAVPATCLQFALEGDERYGVWGGLSTPERDHLAADRRVGA